MSRLIQPVREGILALTLVCGSTAAADGPRNPWSRFQNGGYPSTEDESLAVRWSPAENVAWQAEIAGYGQSSPVVADGQVYVTSLTGDQRETYYLTAYRLSSGEKIWETSFANPTPQENTPMTSRAAPTSIADSNGCIAFFEGGLVVSVSRDGATRWTRNLVDDYGDIAARHGLSASLEQNDSSVFVWVEREKDPYLLALDKASGQNVWKSEGVGATSWASPRLIPVDDGKHLVCSASGTIIGIDPQTGQRLWKFSEIANNTSCTPVPVGKNRFLIGASDGRGEESEGNGAAYNGLIEIKRKNGGYDVSYLWNAEKASSSFGTPIVAAGNACIVNRAGVLHRLNVETGESISTDRTSAGGIWATPIAVENRLYLFGYKGTTAVISLLDGSELAENRLWEAVGGDLAAGGGVLYAAVAAPPYLILRRGDRLYAVKEQNESDQTRSR